MTVEASARSHNPTLVERLLDQQREGWRRGERLFVEALLERHPALAADREGLLDLIRNEVDLRASRGETVRLDEYRQRFPDLTEDLGRKFEAIAGPGAGASEGQARSVETTAGADTGPPDEEMIPPPTAVPPPEIEGYEIQRAADPFRGPGTAG